MVELLLMYLPSKSSSMIRYKARQMWLTPRVLAHYRSWKSLTHMVYFSSGALSSRFFKNRMLGFLYGYSLVKSNCSVYEAPLYVLLYGPLNVTFHVVLSSIYNVSFLP